MIPDRFRGLPFDTEHMPCKSLRGHIPDLYPHLRQIRPSVGDGKSKVGLGVAISTAITEAMGGEIGNEVRPDTTAVFFVELPLGH